MSRHPSSNIVNRSPWLVTVRTRPERDRRFSFVQRQAAEAYLEALIAEGLKGKLVQLETSFQLRLRRVGMKDQVVTFDTRLAAEQALRHIESQHSVGIVRDYIVATRYTLADLIQRYITEVVPRHKGGEVEICRLRRILRTEAFVDLKLAVLSTEDLQEFIHSRLEEVAPATVNRDLDLISQVLHYADDVWKIAPAESPMKGLRRPTFCNERDRRLKEGEEKSLLTAARQYPNAYVEAAIILALETAMRRSELLAMRCENVNFEERFAFLPDTKNGHPRKVPLTQRAMQVLRALPATDDGRVLGLSANALKKAFFGSVLVVSGIEDLTFHDLRHEAISRLAESGRFDLSELQAVSGHRDIRMLLRYVHLFPKRVAEKMDLCAKLDSGKYEWDRGGKRRLRRVRQSDESKPTAANTVVSHLADEGGQGAEPAAVCDADVFAPEAGGGIATGLPENVISFESVRRQRTA